MGVYDIPVPVPVGVLVLLVTGVSGLVRPHSFCTGPACSCVAPLDMTWVGLAGEVEEVLELETMGAGAVVVTAAGAGV